MLMKLKNNDLNGAADEFLDIIKSGGQVLQGLV